MKRQCDDLDFEQESRKIKKSDESVHNKTYQKISKLVEVARDFAEDEELFMLLLTKNFSNGVDDIDRDDRLKVFLEITRVLPSYREVMSKLLSKNLKKLIFKKCYGYGIYEFEYPGLKDLFGCFPEYEKWYEAIKSSFLKSTRYQSGVSENMLLSKFENILRILSLAGLPLQEVESSLLSMFDYKKEEKEVALRRALENICDEIILNMPLSPRITFFGELVIMPKSQPRILAFRELAVSLPKELHIELVIILKNKFKDLILKLDTEDRNLAFFTLARVLPDHSSEIMDIFEIYLEDMLFNSNVSSEDRLLYLRDLARLEVMFQHHHRIMNIAIKYYDDIFCGFFCDKELPALADVMPAYSSVLLAESADQVGEIVRKLKEENIEEATAFLCLNLPDKDEQVKAFIKIIEVLPCQKAKLKKLLFEDVDAVFSYFRDYKIEDAYIHNLIENFQEELCSLLILEESDKYIDRLGEYLSEILEKVGNAATKLRISCSNLFQSETESESEYGSETESESEYGSESEYEAESEYETESEPEFVTDTANCGC